MRNKISAFLLLLLGAGIFFLQGCGGGKGKREGSTKIAHIKPEKTEIAGPLQEYIEIVDNEYEITTEPWGSGDDYNAYILIKIKGKKAVPADMLDKKIPKISLSLKDEKGNPVSDLKEFNLYAVGVDEKLLEILKSGQGEELIKFSVYTGTYNPEKHADIVKKFSASSGIDDQPEEEKTTEATETPAETTSGSSDCATFAKEYGEFIDEYISIYKKYKSDPANLDNISKYTKLLEKLDKMNKDKDAMKDCTGNAEYGAEILKHVQRLNEALSAQ